MPPVKHYSRGASNSKRWMHCPGSIRECTGIPNKSSIYADEGTAAHFLAEQCLRQGKDASEFLHKEIGLSEERDAFFVEVDDWENPTFKVTEEMVEAVQVYLDTIQEVKSRNPGAEVRIEHKFHLGSIHPELGGTCDCVIVLPFERLVVLDYKHGRGVAVDAEENSQAMIYALGAAITEDIEDVEIVIVQPRAIHREGPVRRWTISRADLMAWAEEVLRPAALATDDPTAPLAAGDHCKFCPAGAVCPEKRQAAFAEAKLSFDDGMFPAPIEHQPTLPDVRSLTAEQATRILEVAPLFEDFVRDVRGYMDAGLESGRFMPGVDGCGFKRVKGNLGHRKFRDDTLAKGTLFPILRGKETEIKLRSPAQIESQIKAGLKDGTIRERDLRGMNPKEFIGALVTRPEGKIIMVPISDPRPALDPTTPEEAFDGGIPLPSETEELDSYNF